MSLTYSLDKQLNFPLNENLDQIHRHDAGVGFLPTDLEALVAWYDAQDEGTVSTVSNLVDQWDDKGEGGYNAVQPVVVDRFEYVQPSAVANNYNALVNPDAENAFSVKHVETPSLPSVGKVYVVCAYEGGTETDVLVNGNIFGSEDSPEKTLQLNSTSDSFQYNSEISALSVNGESYASAGYVMPLALSVVEVTFASQITSVFALGNIKTSGLFGWHGPIGEFIFTDGTESAAEATQVRNYLYNKWNIVPPSTGIGTWIIGDTFVVS